MNKERLKDALVAILIGACVAFLTTLIEGLRDLMLGVPPEAPASAVAMARYLWKHMV